MIMVQISEGKKREMAELAEEMLHVGGKLMQCINNLSEEGSMGERWEDPGYYGERNDYPMGERGYGGSMGDRSYGGSIGERRGVRGTGRYSRY